MVKWIFALLICGAIAPLAQAPYLQHRRTVSRTATTSDGPNVWYDTSGTTSGWSGIGSSFMEYHSLTVSVSGTATKLRIRVRGGLSDATAKIAIYDNGGALKGTCTTPTITASSADTTYEVNLDASFACSAGTYTLAVSASSSIEVRVNADSGGSFSGQSYAGFPPGTLPAPDGAFDSIIGGVYVD